MAQSFAPCGIRTRGRKDSKDNDTYTESDFGHSETAIYLQYDSNGK